MLNMCSVPNCIHTALKWFGLSALLILQSVPSCKRPFHISRGLSMPHGVIKHCTVQKGVIDGFFLFVLFYLNTFIISS